MDNDETWGYEARCPCGTVNQDFYAKKFYTSEAEARQESFNLLSAVGWELAPFYSFGDRCPTCVRALKESGADVGAGI